MFREHISNKIVAGEIISVLVTMIISIADFLRGRRIQIGISNAGRNAARRNREVVAVQSNISAPPDLASLCPTFMDDVVISCLIMLVVILSVLSSVSWIRISSACDCT